MTRHQQIIHLAQTLHLALDTDSIQAGHSTNRQDRVLQLSDLYHSGSYLELEQALQHLRTHHPSLHWHFTQRHLHYQQRPTPVRQTATQTLLIHRNGDWTNANGPNYEPAPEAGLAQVNGHLAIAMQSWDERVDRTKVTAALDHLSEQMPKTIRLPDWEQVA